jgi:hypothetical protein
MVLATSLFTTLAHSASTDVTPTPFIIGLDTSNLYGKTAALIYTEAFKRLAIPVKFESLTFARRSLQADNGDIDGEGARVYEYGAAHPNLVRVEESIVDLHFALFTANPTLHLNRLDELSSTPYLVEYKRGILLCETKLKQLLPPERLSELTSTDQGVKKLLAGRTDLYCDIEFFVLQALHSLEVKGVSTVHKAFDFGVIPTYPYLHKKHAELAPRLAATLKKMKSEGLIEAYRLQAEREMGWAQ